MSEDRYSTRQTLLMRARNQDDHDAWEEFASVYDRFIHYVLLKMNISQSDVDDLKQDVLVKLWKKLPTYEPQKSKFRSWLSLVIRSLVLNYFDSNSRRSARMEKLADNSDTFAYLKNTSPAEIDNIIELEWKSHVSKLAFENVQKIFSGKAIDVFQLSTKGYTNQVISEKLDIKLDTVKVLKSRVKSRYIVELKKIIHEHEELQFLDDGVFFSSTCVLRRCFGTDIRLCHKAPSRYTKDRQSSHHNRQIYLEIVVNQKELQLVEFEYNDQIDEFFEVAEENSELDLSLVCPLFQSLLEIDERYTDISFIAQGGMKKISLNLAML